MKAPTDSAVNCGIKDVEGGDPTSSRFIQQQLVGVAHQRVELSLAAPCPTSLSEIHNCDIVLHNLSCYIEIGAVLVQFILLGI